jgi:hypothetical protein
MGANAKASGSFLGLGGGPVIIPLPGGGNKAIENFNSGPSQRKVDILFVDDNSASMDPLQSSLGSKFPAFSDALQGLDWQVGVTTTDCSAGPYGICGSLVPIAGVGGTLLTPSIANFQQAFNDTIVRPETVGCIARGDCPSGISEPLKAAMSAFDKRNTSNAGFFRAGASLAVIMLTNADEKNDGTGSPTSAQAVVNRFRSIWGNSKDMKAYAVDVIPGDTACLNSASAASSGQVFYGKGPSALATLTGGLSESICAADFSPLLAQIGDDLQTVPNVITLAHTPKAGTLEVSLTPDPGISFTSVGNVVVFARALPADTAITITYEF